MYLYLCFMATTGSLAVLQWTDKLLHIDGLTVFKGPCYAEYEVCRLLIE